MPDAPIDWQAAIRTGQRLAPRGPAVTASEAREAVADLRRFSVYAEQRVRETTGLGADVPVSEGEVVDRRGWIVAAADGMAALTRSLTERLRTGGPGGAAVGSQVGVLLGYMSGRVLGQYDPVGRAAGSGDGETPGVGRLLLVAPNVIKVEREIDALPTDFRLWVCLHESTHRVQFQAVPWMVDHFRSLVDAYAAVAPVDGSELLHRLRHALTIRPPRGRHAAGPDGQAPADGAVPADPDSWLRRIQTPDQLAIFDQLMVLMTLLEGHADFVMDAVGPAVVPSVDHIRAAFTERRRKGRGPIDRIVRAVLGMDLKLAQYSRGAAFVRRIVQRVGMDGFNAVWSAPGRLPTLTEIAEPDRWVRRVHG